jgi:hypothetical protein
MKPENALQIRNFKPRKNGTKKSPGNSGAKEGDIGILKFRLI